MTTTVFVDNATPIVAAWLNDVNATTYTTVPALQVSVQNSSSQILSSVAGTNTITGVLTPTLTVYVAGQTFRFVATGTNTGAVTININGLGAKAITKSGSIALDAYDIVIGSAIQVVYDGTQFQLTSGAGSSAGNNLTQNNLNVPALTGRSLVGPITFTGVSTISGRLVIL